MLTNSIDGFVQAVYAFVLICLIVLPMWLFGPTVETALAPVVADFTAVPIDTTNDSTTYSISFNKVRDCVIVPNFTSWFVSKEGAFERIDVLNISNPDGKPFVRPVGKNAGIIWKVDNKKFAPYDKQTIIFYHQCHPLWLTKTVINIP